MYYLLFLYTHSIFICTLSPPFTHIQHFYLWLITPFYTCVSFLHPFSPLYTYIVFLICPLLLYTSPPLTYTPHFLLRGNFSIFIHISDFYLENTPFCINLGILISFLLCINIRNDYSSPLPHFPILTLIKIHNKLKIIELLFGHYK